MVTDCKTHKVVVKGEKADPLKVLERVQKKSHRQVELLSPIPKPPPPPEEEPKKPPEEVAKPEEKKEEVGSLDSSPIHNLFSMPFLFFPLFSFLIWLTRLLHVDFYEVLKLFFIY